VPVAPFPPSTCDSLSDAFYHVPDHRSPLSRRYRKIAMFGLIAHGLLVGSPTVKAIWKRCTALSQSWQVTAEKRTTASSPSPSDSSKKVAPF
jgi:hypothetical protein